MDKFVPLDGTLQTTSDVAIATIAFLLHSEKFVMGVSLMRSLLLTTEQQLDVPLSVLPFDMSFFLSSSLLAMASVIRRHVLFVCFVFFKYVPSNVFESPLSAPSTIH